MSGNKDRSDRLAAALRANLARRKTQARARRADAPALPAPEDAAAGPAPTAPGGDAKNGEKPGPDGSAAPSAPDAKIVPDAEAG